ncbi:MAG: AMP-binding protein, partial [Acidimicrobiales bacterium]
MTEWNFADQWEMCAEVRDGLPALKHGDDHRSWREVDRNAGGIAKALLGAGLTKQAKVAQYLYNCNEYLESVFAAFKVGMVPVNTNYRYGDEELTYLFDNADAEAVVFHGTFAERLERLLKKLERVRLFLWVDDGTGDCPKWATSYEEAADGLSESEDPHVRADWGRSGDDLYFLYTGGTTGMPKGVMWRQDDLFSLLNGGSPVPLPEDKGTKGTREMIEGLQSMQPSVLPACPLMHGTGAFTAFSSLVLGGCVVTMPGRVFDAEALLRTAEREKVNLVTIVGEAFARPILGALEDHEHEEPYDLSNLLGIVSSGVMWSNETKCELLRHLPHVMLIDAFSSSEALGMGSSVSTAGAEAVTATFKVGERAKVIDDDGNELPPGSG